MKASYLFVLLVALFLIGCAPEAPAPEAEEGAPSAPSAPAEREEAAPAEPEAAAEAAVDITKTAFDPEEVTIKAGGTVTWTNTGTSASMIAGPKKLFSEKVEAGETYSFTFEDAGEYQIMNIIPAKFFGTVIVE